MRKNLEKQGKCITFGPSPKWTLRSYYRVLQPIREGGTEGWLAGIKKAEPELCLLGIIEVCSR
ncbi:MAG: hypothetical protein IJ204_05305 [Paludibacteraceae bacterium]|nr:hypothetical protein [Paludibacteraceae bacterium]